MRSTLLVGLVVLLALPAAADTYKWVDKNGVTHYSDRPVPGAVKVEIHETPPSSTPTRPAQSSSSSSSDEQQSPSYRSLDLWRPKNDEVFNNAGQTVSVSVRPDPQLQPGHSIWLYMDGKRVDGLSGNSLNFEVNEVYRGTHTVVATITDNGGKTLISSQTVTFHVRQTSVLAPRWPAAPPKSAGQ